MFVKVHAAGNSFKACAQYLLSDKDDPKSKDRVAWVETCNLGTTDGHTAARVMAATWYNRDDLKREAGVKIGKPVKKGPVLHITLSWKDGEIEGLSRQQMYRAAMDMLKVYGADTTKKRKKAGRKQYADEHQALIVCHTDTKHAQLHVMVNRVHPEHGVMLPDSNDRLKLSRWAQKYQIEHGNEHLTPKRTINNQARKDGQFVKADRELPRQVYELQKSVANDSELKAELLAEHKEKAAELAASGRSIKSRHQREWSGLQIRHDGRKAKVEATAIAGFKADKKRIGEKFWRRREEQFHERQADLAAFERDEATLLGRIKNRFKTIDLKALVGFNSIDRADGRASTIRQAYNMLGSKAARLDAIKQKHEMAGEKLAKVQRAEVAVAGMKRKQQLQTDRKQAQAAYLKERQSLVMKHKGETAQVKAKWRQFEKDRAAKWEVARQKNPAPVGRDYQSKVKAVLGKRAGHAANDDRMPTDPGDLLPKKGSEDAARMIDQMKAIMSDKSKLSPRNKGADKDKGDDRER